MYSAVWSVIYLGERKDRPILYTQTSKAKRFHNAATGDFYITAQQNHTVAKMSSLQGLIGIPMHQSLEILSFLCLCLRGDFSHEISAEVDGAVGGEHITGKKTDQLYQKTTQKKD